MYCANVNCYSYIYLFCQNEYSEVCIQHFKCQIDHFGNTVTPCPRSNVGYNTFLVYGVLSAVCQTWNCALVECYIYQLLCKRTIRGLLFWSSSVRRRSRAKRMEGTIDHTMCTATPLQFDLFCGGFVMKKGCFSICHLQLGDNNIFHSYQRVMMVVTNPQ